MESSCDFPSNKGLRAKGEPRAWRPCSVVGRLVPPPLRLAVVRERRWAAP